MRCQAGKNARKRAPGRRAVLGRIHRAARGRDDFVERIEQVQRGFALVREIQRERRAGPGNERIPADARSPNTLSTLVNEPAPARAIRRSSSATPPSAVAGGSTH